MVLTLVQILAYQQTSHYQCPANSAWTRTKPLNYFAVSHLLSLVLYTFTDRIADIKHSVSSTGYNYSCQSTSSSLISLPPKLLSPPPPPLIYGVWSRLILILFDFSL